MATSASIINSAPTLAILQATGQFPKQSKWSNFYNKTGGNDVWGSGISSIMDSYAQNLEDKNTARAYQKYLNFLNGIASQMGSSLEGRADKYDTKLQNQFNSAEPQFQQEAYSQLPELTQLVQDIANESAEAQRQNQRQINAALAQQGVRGGQAAILANRATGELNRELQRDINKTVYDEAANRQNARLDYYNKKALTPWSTMSGAYGQSMIGANNALSYAQGDVYKNAYNNMMNNYMNAQRKKSGGLGSKIGGVLGGAAGMALTGGNPVGASLGSAAGSYIGGKF